jgi:hypothetical protein
MTVDPFKMTGNHYTSLNEKHLVGPARDVNVSELSYHLIIDHGVALGKAKTKGELGKLHLLVHTLLAHPTLAELLSVPDQYGTGKQSKVKY